MGKYSDFAKKVRRFRDNLEDEHESATEDAMQTIGSELEAALRFNDSVARRDLVNDILNADKPTDPKMVSKRVHMPDWAKYLEHGTGIHSDEGYPAPSNPPFDAIMTWFTAKNLTPREYDTVHGAVGAIAEDISETGNEAHPFIDPVWNGPYGKDHVVDENRRAIRRAKRRSF